MRDIIKTYMRFVVLHKWNKLSKEHFDLLDEHWSNKPQSGIKHKLLMKIREITMNENNIKYETMKLINGVSYLLDVQIDAMGLIVCDKTRN